MNKETLYCKYCIDNKNSVFNILSREEKKIISKNHTSFFFKKGKIIYKKGDIPKGLIYLSKGKVKIFKKGIADREQIIRMAKPLGFIGYRALFAKQNFNVSAIAIEDSTICIIEKDSLFKILKTNSNFSLSILKSMAIELGFSNSRTVTLTQKHIRGRLAESLLFLKDTYGFENDNETIKVYLTRKEMANLSNMTTSNAIKVLSFFAEDKIISTDRRIIKILNLNKLEKISELG